MLSEIGIVGNGLLGRQECQMIGARIIVRVALAVVPVLQNHAHTIEFLHQNLNEPGAEIGKATGSAGLASNIEKDRSAGLVVRVVVVVALSECSLGMRLIARAVWEMVDWHVDVICWVHQLGPVP